VLIAAAADASARQNILVLASAANVRRLQARGSIPISQIRKFGQARNSGVIAIVAKAHLADAHPLLLSSFSSSAASAEATLFIPRCAPHATGA
jgi:hypothetical protein